MDALGSFIINEILRSLGEGNVVKGVFLLGVFVVLWWELRGVKKMVKAMGTQISKSFASGEARFNDIETNQTTMQKKQMDFEHRLTMLEPKH